MCLEEAGKKPREVLVAGQVEELAGDLTVHLANNLEKIPTVECIRILHRWVDCMVMCTAVVRNTV